MEAPTPDHCDILALLKNYNRRTTIPKTAIRRMNPTVIKKLNLRSGNRSVSIIPLVSMTGITAWNKIVEVATSRPIMTSFINPDENVPDVTEKGPMKKRMIRNKETPKRIHEYLVFSLYWAI